MLKTRFFLCAILLLTFILNFYKLEVNPPGLYIDEISIGVNAYSILAAGKDEYGNKFPLYFKAYGDYKLPVYIYLTSLSMALFGKNEFAVRFPSAFLGSLVPFIFFLIIREITKNTKLSLLACFILAVTPWLLHFTGPAFEATVALFFFVAGIYLFTIYQRTENIIAYIFSLVILCLTIFTYNSYKVIIPIMFPFFLFCLVKKHLMEKHPVIHTGLIFLAAFLLSFSVFYGPAAARYLQTTAFTSFSINNLLIFFKNYISYFSADFLFSFGDGINRHQFLNFGGLSRWMLPFLLAGIYLQAKSEISRLKYLLFGLLFIIPIPASLSLPSPHSLRSLAMVLPFSGIIAFGLYSLFQNRGRNLKGLMAALTLVFVYEFSIYLHYGFFHYPKTSLLDWGGNYKETVRQAAKLKSEYPIIAVDESLSFAGEYFRFYDPDLQPLMINSNRIKRNDFNAKPLLLITADIGKIHPLSERIIGTVYLPNENRDIFAQFWEVR